MAPHPKTATTAATSTSKAHTKATTKAAPPTITPSLHPVEQLVPPATTTKAAPPTITPSVFDDLADSALLRESQLVHSPKRPHATAPLPFSAATLWRKVRDGSFPKPVRLSERVTAWRVGDVRAWLNACEVA